MAQEELDLVLGEARSAMSKSAESLERDLMKIRTGRANPVLLEGVTVDYYGTPTPLKSLATVSAPEARLLVVQPFDPGALGEIERGILRAQLGVTPNSDGKLIRVPIPELTEERRRELVKAVRKLGEDHKVGVRTGRRDAISLMKEMEKDGDVTEDESHRGQKLVQGMTDDFTKQIDQLLDAKEQEILTL